MEQLVLLKELVFENVKLKSQLTFKEKEALEKNVPQTFKEKNGKMVLYQLRYSLNILKFLTLKK